MRQASLALMSVFYMVAGSMHFARPEFYLRIMPPYLPWHLPLVYLSGAAEMALGAALWIPSLRPWAAWGIVALLVAVFPANIYMYQEAEALEMSRAALLVRLPIQALLIAWAYRHTRP